MHYLKPKTSFSNLGLLNLRKYLIFIFSKFKKKPIKRMLICMKNCAKEKKNEKKIA